MRHCVDSAGRGKVGCVLSRESVSSLNILLSAFLLITGVSCYGQHCRIFGFHTKFSQIVVLAPRRTGKGNTECLISLMAEAIQSFSYCCNFYHNFTCLLDEIQWPLMKSFDDVPGCC